MGKLNSKIAEEIAAEMKARNLCFMTWDWAKFREFGQIARFSETRGDRLAVKLRHHDIAVAFGTKAVAFSQDRDFAPNGITWAAAKDASDEPPPPPPLKRSRGRPRVRDLDQSSSVGQL